MFIFKKIEDLRRYLDRQVEEGQTVGFVPTMGALHEGHLSLIRYANRETNVSVCSIFVNPTQFNDPADLEKYPRTPGKDIELLLSAGCRALFLPEVSEIYPDQKKKPANTDLGRLATTLEGVHRPGHFDGMAQVIRRLTEIVQPRQMFMGQKDFQQFAVVQYLLKKWRSDIKLVMCPTVREKDGLAMSSRNVRLTPEQREVAPLLYQALTEAKRKIHSHFPKAIREEALQELRAPGLETEYFEIVNGRTLEPVELFEETDFAVACVAARVGDVRLIDNIILKED